jgi:hypothetical protein
MSISLKGMDIKIVYLTSLSLVYVIDIWYYSVTFV